MELILVTDGYNVEKAGCGREGLAKIHNIVPDLIILDLMMPDMTGLEIIEHIRPFERLTRIPIILCTANRFIYQNDIVEIENICYKPIDIDNILNQVHSLTAC